MKNILPKIGLGIAVIVIIAGYPGWSQYLAGAQTVDPQEVKIYRGIAADRPATAPPGTIYVQLSSSAVPTIFVYQTTGWTQIYFDGESPAYASLTLSGVLTANGSITLGSDEDDLITVKSPIEFDVIRENFVHKTALARAESINGNFSAADTVENIFIMWGSTLGLINVRFEQTMTQGVTGWFDGEYFVPDLDDTEDDGVDMTFGGYSNDDYGVCDEDNLSATVGCYAEISLLIGDISETDSLYFGLGLASAFVDAGDYTAYNTTAFFVLQDNAGDLDIETELNGGGTLNDDTGITWADGQEKVLRVVAYADTVEFYVDGVQIAQTNAVLDFDNGDELMVFFGYLNDAGDATPAPGIKINYVEIGKVQ
jgi:hypothetical protein